MIENPPLLTIRRNFPRPSAAELAAFANTPTGFLVDSMNGRGALAYRIKPVSVATSFCGVAITCEAGPGDCLALFGTLDVIKPGDVIVVKADSFTETAVIGDLLLGMMKNNGAAAFVTDGLVRDVPGIVGVGIPCLLRRRHAQLASEDRAGHGRACRSWSAVSRSIQATSLSATRTASWSCPRVRIDETLKNLAQVRKLEAALEAKVKAGLKKTEIVDAILKPGTIKEVD